MAGWGSNGRFQPYLIAVMLLLVATRPALAQTSSLTLDAYWDTLTHIRDDLRAAGDDAAAVRQTAVTTLSAITEIELNDGRRQPIDHSFFIRQLQDEAVSTTQLAQLFTTLPPQPPGLARPHPARAGRNSAERHFKPAGIPIHGGRTKLFAAAVAGHSPGG
jgi:hypothetical protein